MNRKNKKDSLESILDIKISMILLQAFNEEI